MTPKKSVPLAPWAVRQLRRVRSFYAAGIVLWATGAGLEALNHPGSRQMWAQVLLLAVFSGLLSLTFVQLWRHRTALHRAAGRKLSKARPAVTAGPAGAALSTRKAG